MFDWWSQLEALYKESPRIVLVAAHMVAVVVLFTGTVLYSWFERWRTSPARQGDTGWVSPCERAGLANVRAEGRRVTGRTRNLTVELGGVVQDGRLVESWGVEMAVASELRTPGFTLRSMNRPGRHGLRLDDTRTGDELFDRRFEIEGTVATVLATLDAETRRLLLQQDGYGGLDLQGRTATTFCSGAPNGLEIEKALRDALSLSERLNRSVDVRQALADRATSDPVAGVRAEAMRALGRTFQDDPVTRATARTALGDADPGVRIQAATVLGDEGTPTLETLLAEPGLRDPTMAAAITALNQRLTTARALELLADARQRRRHLTAYACIHRLAKGPVEVALGPLVQVLKLDDGELACAAARAIGALGVGSPAAESALVVGLGSDLPALRHETAMALGRVGTVAAVVRLKAAEKNVADEQFSIVVRRAIAAIQSRASGAGHGQLTLSDDEGGRLTLAGREAGQLSEPAGEQGQLSAPDDEAGRLSLGRTPTRS